MPGNTYFYPETIRNLMVALMDMFNGIRIRRFEKDKVTVISEFKPPMRFGPADSIYMQRKAAETTCDNYYLTFPRFAMEWTSLSYDSERAYGADQLRSFYDTEIGLANMDEFWSDVQPAPYDFGFTLHIKTNNLTDFLQIVEQIYPFFHPDLYLRIKEFSFLNIERDIQVTIGDLSPDFLMDVNAEDKRYVNADIPITCKGFLMRPLSTMRIIKQINTKFNLYDPSTEYNVNVSDYSTSGIFDKSTAPETAWDITDLGYINNYQVSAYTNSENYK